MTRIVLPKKYNSLCLCVRTGAMAGRFKLERKKADSGVVVHETPWMDNLITNAGLDSYYTAPSFAYGMGYPIAQIRVGTGNTTPQFTDIALANDLAGAGGINGTSSIVSSNYVAASGPTPAYWSTINKYQFGTGVAAGNLTEIGAQPYGQSALFSRALITDSNGNPTSITVLSDEILTVTYELRLYLDTTDKAFTFNLNGVPYPGTYRLMQIASSPGMYRTMYRNSDNNTESAVLYSGAMGPITGGPAGSGVRAYPSSYGTYSAGNYYIDMTYLWGISDAVWAGGIQSFATVSPLHSLQFGLTNPIMKTSGQQLQLSFRYAWGRYTP